MKSTTAAESERLRLLAELGVMDSAPEATLDELVSLAAAICGAPIALISFVDATRQWFKARVGLDVSETPRELAFCAHVIAAESDDVFVVPDASKDPRFATNPLVTGAPNIAFYAAAPLVVEGGAKLGTLCVIDRTPRELTPLQLRSLTTLSHVVVEHLELTRAVAEKTAAEALLVSALDEKHHLEAERDELFREREGLLAAAKAGQRLAETDRARLYGLLMQIPAAIAVMRGPEHVYELMNPTFQTIVGGRAHFGQSVREAFPELAGQQIVEVLDQVFASGEPFVGREFPIRLVRDAGESPQESYFDLVCQALRSRGNVIEGVLAFGVDVTNQVLTRRRIEEVSEERQHLLQARDRAERELERIFETSLDFLCWSRDARIVRANQAFKDALGWSYEDLYSRPIVDFMHPDDLPRVMEQRDALQRGEPAQRFEARYRRRDGTYRWISWSAVSEQGTTFGFGRDVTEDRALGDARVKLLEEQGHARAAAESANRAMDQFLATVSHELRTPLNAMLGWTRLMRNNQVSDAQRPKALETIERNAVAQSQLIEDLLDVSRIISGQMRLDVVPIELGSIIEAAIDTMRPAANAKQIRLGSVLDPRGGHVVGDAARLQQVVWNLLSNAVKFTPKDGQVAVRLTQAASCVELTVSDTGRGMDAEFLPKAFDRFGQADGGLNRSYGGLGLGLAIVKNIVELHGGTVRAESAGIDRGSSFVVQLPLSLLRVESPSAAVAAYPRIENSAPFDCPPELEELRVLVVDDEEDARELLVAILSRCGARVTTAASVGEAIAAFEAARFSVVLSDLGMPDEDGYSLIKKLRALPLDQGGRTPVIALTAYARAEDRMRVLRAGFNTHVSKPLEPSELLAVIASVVERSL
ncbi:MAG TPA: ATP-binding protein [Polyangiaceae bacterium]|nr:ATP-binding protein [Polyangiaceae bacterium]